MAYNLKTVGTRLEEIEAEMAKVEEWGSGNSRVKNRTLAELEKEYKHLKNLIHSDEDLDKTRIALEIRAKSASRKVYALQ